MTSFDDAIRTTWANQSLRIIYADDVQELRDVARISLSRDGHRIECVNDGREALDRLSADPDGYDLIITDHHMPNMNGIQLVRGVRELPFRGKILIFCSELSPIVSDAYRQLEVNRILFKPVFPSDLRRALVELYLHDAPQHKAD